MLRPDKTQKKKLMDSYGKELIIDLHLCDVSKFNRKSLREYFKKLCLLIDMQRAKLVFWDDVGVPESEKQTLPHTTGTSAVQFILTSNITIHTLDKLENVYINIFSCKDFDHLTAKDFTINFFKGHCVHWQIIERR
ncbi:MAG: S-adenosylmethionine decarboxylase [Candidatus Nanoarchaeia archaeon]|nr:S-adenosylmethionine decarboxylase [Candidatus Nanoarchaeia archaeon]